MCHHRRANNMFDWDRVFTNINLNGRVLVLNKTNLNMHSNFVSHESAILYKEHKKSYKKIMGTKTNRNSENNSTTHFLKMLNFLQEYRNDEIKVSKRSYCYDLPLLPLTCHFISRQELLTAIHSFKHTDFFWRIKLSHQFLEVGCYFFTEQLLSPILSTLLYLMQRHLAAIFSFWGYRG